MPWWHLFLTKEMHCCVEYLLLFWTRCYGFRTLQLVLYLFVKHMSQSPQFSRDHTGFPLGNGYSIRSSRLLLRPLKAYLQTISWNFSRNASQSGSWDTVSTSVSLYPEPGSSHVVTRPSLHCTKIMNNLPVEIRATTGLKNFKSTIRTYFLCQAFSY